MLLLACLASLAFARVDADFVSDAATANLATMALAELAIERGSAEVRDLARMILDDRRYVREQLRLIGMRAGYTLPDQPSPAQQLIYDRLATLTGKEFDTAYLVEMQRYHRGAVARFRDEAEHGTDLDLRRFAGSMLRTLEQAAQVASRSVQRL